MLVKLPCLAYSVVSSKGVTDKDLEVGPYDFGYFLNLLHQVLAGLHPAGSVNQDAVDFVGFGIQHGVPGNGGRIRAIVLGNDFQVQSLCMLF